MWEQSQIWPNNAPISCRLYMLCILPPTKVYILGYSFTPYIKYTIHKCILLRCKLIRRWKWPLLKNWRSWSSGVPVQQQHLSRRISRSITRHFGFHGAWSFAEWKLRKVLWYLVVGMLYHRNVDWSSPLECSWNIQLLPPNVQSKSNHCVMSPWVLYSHAIW